ASDDFPVANPLQSSKPASSGETGFVLKFNRTATTLLYSTYFGGSTWDIINGLSVTGFGTVYIAGLTNSDDFPTKNGIQPAKDGDSADAFIAKIADASGGSVDTNILISLRTGHIQVYNAAGSLTRDIVGVDDGAAKGMRFDGAGNLFVAHWMGSSPATG